MSFTFSVKPGTAAPRVGAAPRTVSVSGRLGARFGMGRGDGLEAHPLDDEEMGGSDEDDDLLGTEGGDDGRRAPVTYTKSMGITTSDGDEEEEDEEEDQEDEEEDEEDEEPEEPPPLGDEEEAKQTDEELPDAPGADAELSAAYDAARALADPRWAEFKGHPTDWSRLLQAGFTSKLFDGDGRIGVSPERAQAYLEKRMADERSGPKFPQAYDAASTDWLTNAPFREAVRSAVKDRSSLDRFLASLDVRSSATVTDPVTKVTQPAWLKKFREVMVQALTIASKNGFEDLGPKLHDLATWENGGASAKAAELLCAYARDYFMLLEARRKHAKRAIANGVAQSRQARPGDDGPYNEGSSGVQNHFIKQYYMTHEQYLLKATTMQDKEDIKEDIKALAQANLSPADYANVLTWLDDANFFRAGKGTFQRMLTRVKSNVRTRAKKAPGSGEPPATPSVARSASREEEEEEEEDDERAPPPAAPNKKAGRSRRVPDEGRIPTFKEALAAKEPNDKGEKKVSLPPAFTDFVNAHFDNFLGAPIPSSGKWSDGYLDSFKTAWLGELGSTEDAKAAIETWFSNEPVVDEATKKSFDPRKATETDIKKKVSDKKAREAKKAAKGNQP